MQYPSEYAQRSPSGRLLQPWAETTWPGLLSSCSPATSDTQLGSMLSRDESRLVKYVLKCQHHHIASQKQWPAWPFSLPFVHLKSQLFLFYWFCLLTDGATTTNSKEDQKKCFKSILDPNTSLSISCFVQYTDYKTIMISTANMKKEISKYINTSCFTPSVM